VLIALIIIGCNINFKGGTQTRNPLNVTSHHQLHPRLFGRLFAFGFYVNTFNLPHHIKLHADPLPTTVVYL